MKTMYKAKPQYKLFVSESENEITPCMHLRRISQSVTNECLSSYGKPDHVLYRCGVPGDGSCFFHSICASLDVGRWNTRRWTSRTQIGLTFRRLCREMMNAPEFEKDWVKSFATPPSVANIMAKMEKPSEWADIWIISWVMWRFKIGCIFFDGTSGGKIYCGVEGDPHAITFVMIQWVNRSHFEPIFLHDGNHMMTSLSPDHSFTKHLRTIYHRECPCPSQRSQRSQR